MMDTNLVVGRSCGSCNVCCVVPTIDDPALQKLPGYRCDNAQPGGACDIYETRPRTCRAFFCGWRRLDWIADGLRPDASGVFVRLATEGEFATAPGGFAVMVTLLDGESLKAEGLADTVAAAIRADLDAYLIVPGRPGYTSSRVPLNAVLGDIARRMDKAEILRTLERLRGAALARSAETRPVILASHADGGAARPAAPRDEP
jgi:Fe-S-cluster containining protein